MHLGRQIVSILAVAIPLMHAGSSYALSDPTLSHEAAQKHVRNQVQNGWVTPKRMRWLVSNTPPEGRSDVVDWYIVGTKYGARLYPVASALHPKDEKGREVVYEIDATALSENYGVIDFYLYSFPKALEPKEVPKKPSSSKASSVDSRS